MANNASTSTQNTTYMEDQSTQRPPFFNGLNYSYWATRMSFFMQLIVMMLGMQLKKK